MIPERIETKDKPIKGHIIEADFFRWPTQDKETGDSNGKHVVCVTGYKDRIGFSNDIRTSWIEKTYESMGKRFVETRNSIYSVDLNDTNWKVLQDELKHENLDVERMKR